MAHVKGKDTGQVTITKAEFDKLVTFVFLTNTDDQHIVIKNSHGSGIGTITMVYVGDQQFDITEYEAW